MRLRLLGHSEAASFHWASSSYVGADVDHDYLGEWWHESSVPYGTHGR